MSSARRLRRSRRALLKGAGAAALCLILPRKSEGAPLGLGAFLDREIVERMADRDPSLRPPLLIDLQTHVWWRAGGVRTISPRAQHFFEQLCGTRSRVLGRPVAIADMGRLTFIEDVFLQSETDLAFLNSFGMKGEFDGIDLFPPREAVAIRAMAPARIRVHGTVDPPDGKAAEESLEYQCTSLKIDSLKLYPPGFVPDRRFWRMDDQQLTYPLLSILRKHGVKNVCVHTGHMSPRPAKREVEPCLRAGVLAQAAADFPDLNFIAFHSCYPWERELADLAKAAKVKNLYAELGGLARLMLDDPTRYAELVATLITGMGADHVLWGTDTPLWGPPHWQVQYFQALRFPPALAERLGLALTWQHKQQILGGNVARLYKIDVPAARRAIEGDLLYRMRADHNPLPLVIDPLKAVSPR